MQSVKPRTKRSKNFMKSFSLLRPQKKNRTKIVHSYSWTKKRFSLYYPLLHYYNIHPQYSLAAVVTKTLTNKLRCRPRFWLYCGFNFRAKLKRLKLNVTIATAIKLIFAYFLFCSNNLTKTTTTHADQSPASIIQMKGDNFCRFFLLFYFEIKNKHWVILISKSLCAV